MIHIYNTLTRRKERFEPLEAGQVKMYVCGPTVYNYIHIGNARSTVAFDTIRRYFLYRGYQVQYVSNFTDVDDKIIRVANETNQHPNDVAQQYIDAFYEDTAALNVLRATKNPRVVESMEDIIAFIQVLLDKEFAYEVQGDVYYRTRRFTDYGKLSDQTIAELQVGASERLTDEEQAKKEDPLDFALWKSAKTGEIHWHAPWGAGRPGWHIECSVMATKYLGDTIDIHGGGQDLAFPHHENEIAQSEAKTGHPFATYWMHNGFVTMGEDNEKMSKSLGNFVLLHDLLERVSGEVLRFFLASAHYRRPLKFTEAAIEEARNNLRKLQTAYRNVSYRLSDAQSTDAPADDAFLARIVALTERFVVEMDDDFNAANGMTVVYEIAKELNIYSEQAVVSKPAIEQALQHYASLLEVFGIVVQADGALLDEQIEALLAERVEARKNKDFARSDAIRDQLKEQGILLDDTPQGTRWRRV